MVTVQTPPNYRSATEPGISCNSCKYFDKSSNVCVQYSAKVRPQDTCDAFEEININVNQIQDTETIQPVEPEVDMPKSASKRPDRYEDWKSWMSAASHHPDTTSMAMTMPANMMGKSPDQIRDETKQRLTTKEAFKAAFLLRCSEEQLSPEEIEQRLDKAIEKLASDPITATLNLLGSGAGRLADLAVVGPPVAGGALGYLLAKAKSPKVDEDAIHTEELKNEYLRLAESAKRKLAIRKMQMENPGTIVQLS